LRPATIQGFLDGLPLVFQRNQSGGLDATYHFTFTGREPPRATIIIRNKELKVLQTHSDRPDLSVTADADTWLRFLAKEKRITTALLTGRIRLRGPLRLLKAFARCFPG
jgi:putative sterol carrier protein